MRNIAYLLSLVLVFTIPWENAIHFEEFGTLSRVIGLLTASAWLVSVLHARQFRKLNFIHVFMFSFLFWNIVSIFWTAGYDETVQRIKTYAQMIILVWIFWDLYTKEDDLKAALVAYIFGAYVSIGSTVYIYLTSQNSSSRYAGAGINAVELALILALGMPIAWHLAVTAGSSLKDRIFRILHYTYIPASLFATILTASRMAVIAVVPALLYIVGTSYRLKPLYRLLIFLILGGALLFLLPYIPQSAIERLATIDDSIEALDFGGRMTLWRASFRIYSEHPVLGIGSGALHRSSELGGAAHNTFLSVLAELGIIGFILFAGILANVVYQALAQKKALSRLWLTILMIWVIGVSTLTWEIAKSTWLFFSLIAISKNMHYKDTDSY